MKRLSKLVPLIAVIGLLVLALLPASAPANPASGTISFTGTGTLLTDGTVDVTLHYSCLPPSGGFVFANLNENGVSSGSGFLAPATCDGRTHSVTLNMAPGPFTRGTAAGFAEVANGAVFATTQQQVTIR